MNDKGTIAAEYFLNGCNCAQSVLMAFVKDFGLDEKTALKMASVFGGGMGGQREVCGALSGMYMALGLKYGSVDPTDSSQKKKLYDQTKDLSAKFTEIHSSIICRDLLKTLASDSSPKQRDAKYYKERPCARFVADAARLLQECFEFTQ